MKGFELGWGQVAQLVWLRRGLYQASIHSEIAAASSVSCANLIAVAQGARASAAPPRFPTHSPRPMSTTLEFGAVATSFWPHFRALPTDQGDEMANLSHKALSEGHRHGRAGSFNSSLAHIQTVAPD